MVMKEKKDSFESKSFKYGVQLVGNCNQISLVNFIKIVLFLSIFLFSNWDFSFFL